MALLSSRISLSLRTDGPTECSLQRMCMYIYILLSLLFKNLSTWKPCGSAFVSLEEFTIYR